MDGDADPAGFYGRLPALRDFANQAFLGRCYQMLPTDWWLVIADIESSTRVVLDGRYAEVNYVGAACIAAVRNQIHPVEVASSFGGDGACFAVPDALRRSVLDALLATAHWAWAAFGLRLRVGAVPVSQLTARGVGLALARLELSPGNSMAMFRGDGLKLAEALIKMPGSPYRHEPDEDGIGTPDLSSLSCRWAPLRPARGIVYCLIVGCPEQADMTADTTADVQGGGAERDQAVLAAVLARIVRIAQVVSENELNPVRVQALSFSPDLAKLGREVKSASGNRWWAWLRALGINLLGWIMFRTGLRLAGLRPEQYKRETVINTDFKKICGELKLVLDLSSEQADAVDAYLEQRYAAGELVFGAFRAPRAVMTCIAPGPADNDHVHYIDGSDGGLWRAAQALKARLAAAETSRDGTHAVEGVVADPC